MDLKEIIKALILLGGYVVVAPALGFYLRGNKRWQRVAFFFMCFMTIRGLFTEAEWGLTLGFDQNYRGQVRGFHFFFNEILAIALILAHWLENRQEFRWRPPGLFMYLVYCALCFISIINAPGKVYVLMVLFLSLKILILFIATYNFLKSEDEIRFFLFTMSITILWEWFVVVKMKYVDGMHQVKGTFEHQNALAMYANLIGMVLLGAGAAKVKRANLCIMAYIACAIIVIFTLSRGGLVVFGVGTVAILLLSLIQKVTRRRLSVVGIVTLTCGIVLVLTFDTIKARFNDPYTAESKRTRDMLRQASVSMYQDHRLGVGWNNYGVTINHPYHYGNHIDDYFRKAGDEIDKKAAKGIEESHYYLLLAETGFQGLTAFIVFITLFLWWSLKCAWFFRKHFMGAVCLGIAMGCMVNYSQSFLERVLTQPRNMMLWFILLAIVARVETWRRMAIRQGVAPEPTEEHPTSRVRRREPVFARTRAA